MSGELLFIYSTTGDKLHSPDIGVDLQLHAEEPVEFEIKPVELEHSRKITVQYIRLYRVHPVQLRKTGHMNMDPVGLPNKSMTTCYVEECVTLPAEKGPSRFKYTRQIKK